MELHNATKMVAGFTIGQQPDGRELFVVVVKGTFSLPKDGGEAKLADEQVPLVEADVFTGEPGVSAPLHESDYPPRKPRCDILLNGSAYAPGGKPTDRLTVALKVGSWSKSFDVVGQRVWKAGLLQPSATPPEPFTVLPISYNNAFGGVDRSQEDPSKHVWYPQNPVGVGFFESGRSKQIDGQPLPNTEETGKQVTTPNGKYRPMAFGPIARSWAPRPQYAGTYDDHWMNNVFPFLPSDFEEDYYQAAPEDQQVDYPQGGEEVELRNLTTEGRTNFLLPKSDLLIELSRGSGTESKPAVCDTVYLEPDLQRLQLVWRVAWPLKKNIFEVDRVVVGKMSSGWHRAQATGKTYYASLSEMIRSREGL
jgi:hypothetical protein